MADKAPASKNYRDIAQGFGVCTLAVIFLYLMSGMNAVSLREMPLSVLMTVFTTACVYYVTRAFVSNTKKYLSLVSAVPVFAIYMLIFTLSFKAVNRASDSGNAETVGGCHYRNHQEQYSHADCICGFQFHEQQDHHRPERCRKASRSW